MLTKEDITQIALLIARSNGHPAPEAYAGIMAMHFEHMNGVAQAAPPVPLADTFTELVNTTIRNSTAALAGTPVLTDPTQWPAPVANTDIAV